MSEDNKKENLDEWYSKKYQKHVACSYDYKLVSVDDKFCKPFQSYFGEDATILLIVCSKKGNIVVMSWKKHFK